MLMDSVAVCCTGHGSSPRGDSDPGVRRAPQPLGELLRIEPKARHVTTPGWWACTVALSPAVVEASPSGAVLPKVLADVQRAATDTALIATLSELAGEVESNTRRPIFPRPTGSVGELLR